MLIACPFLDHLQCDSDLLEPALVNSMLEANLCAPLLADQTKMTEQKSIVLLPIIHAANNVDLNDHTFSSEGSHVSRLCGPLLPIYL